jgi:quinol-cytochrome oxidoreductase complex cytochrome b subunit
MTPRRLVVWILGAAIGIALVVTGIVGILTKAR